MKNGAPDNTIMKLSGEKQEYWDPRERFLLILFKFDVWLGNIMYNQSESKAA